MISPIRFKDFEVSWAGSFPLRENGFCFGSEDGRILCTDCDGGELWTLATGSREAINGVAFIGHWMSVSTRSEVMLWNLARRIEQVAAGTTSGAKFPIGAHGVINGVGGFFFAPAGREGLVFFQPKDGPEQHVTISSPATERVNRYRVIDVQAASGQEIIACANRLGGVAAMEFQGGDQQHQLNSLIFEGLDVVDLCPLKIPTMPAAVAAVGKDGTLILFQDVLTDRNPITIKYESIQGTAYHILSARGYIFLLTSEGLYVIAELIELFQKGSATNAMTPVLALPMEAVDANLGGNECVLIVTPDEVLRLDTRLLDLSKTGTNIDQSLARETILTPRQAVLGLNSSSLAAA